MSLLWRNVIGQAIRDVYCGTPKDVVEVVRWLDTDWFDAVCGMADVHPSDMRQQIAALTTLPKNLRTKYGMLLRQKVIRD